MTEQDRLAAIEDLKSELNKKAGERYLTSLLDQATIGVDVISTRTPSLDIALRVGGLPRGRIVEIYGPEQSGKTTVALQCAAVAQQMGLVTLYVDGENSLDPTYCASLGLDVDSPDFIICQPDYGEQGLNTVIEFLKAGLVDVVVIDSIASLTPKAKLLGLAGDISENGTIATDKGEKKSAEEADMEDFAKFVGLQARMYAAFCSIAPQLVRKHNVCLIGLNQIRTGISRHGGYETRPGGNAWFHAVSVRVDVRRTDTEMTGSGENQIAQFGETKAHVKKNKVGVPHRQAIFDLVFGEGADYYKNLIETCCKERVGFIKKGSRVQPLTISGEELGKSKWMKDAAAWLKDDAEGLQHLRDVVDALSEKVGITLYDPTRPDRKVGPIPGAQVILESAVDEDELAGIAEPMFPEPVVELAV